MANYNLTQTGDEVQAYIDSIPVIDVTGTLNGSAITFGSNPYSQIAANYAADCGSIVRLTVGTAVYLLRVTQYDGTNYTAAEMSGAHNVVATIGSSSASATIDAGIDATPTQDSNNLVKSGGVYSSLVEYIGLPQSSTENANVNVPTGFLKVYTYTVKYDGSQIHYEIELHTQGTSRLYLYKNAAPTAIPPTIYISGSHVSEDLPMSGITAGTKIVFYTYGTTTAGTADFTITETVLPPSDSINPRLENLENEVAESSPIIDELEQSVGLTKTNSVSEENHSFPGSSGAVHTRSIATYNTEYDSSSVKVSISNVSASSASRLITYLVSAGSHQENVTLNGGAAETVRDLSGYPAGTNVYVYLYLDDASQSGTCDFTIVETLKYGADTLNGRVDTLEENTQTGVIISPYKDKIAVCCGDSHAVRRAKWMPRLCEGIGATYDAETTAIIVGAANEVGSGYEKYGDPLLAQAARVVEQHQLGKQIDIIIAENVHYSETWNADAMPIKIKNVINVGNTGVRRSQAKTYFDNNINSIIGNVTPTLGSVCMVNISDSSIKLTFSGTPTAGTMTLTIDGVAFPQELQGTEALNEAVQLLGSWAFQDYTDWQGEVSNNIITLSYVGTEQSVPTPTISFTSGTTGVTMAQSTQTITSTYPIYFNSYATADWLDSTKWLSISGWYLGGLKGFYETILEEIPNAEIICVSFPCYAVNPTTFNTDIGEDMSAFYNSTFYANNRKRATTFMAAGSFYNAKVFDVEKLSNVTLQNWFTFFPSSDVHPNDSGYAKWADVIIKALV